MRRYISEIAERRGLDPAVGFLILEQFARVVEGVDHSLYEAHEEIARARITARDPEDWPIVATALLLDCPIWTEDQDFFGSGIATWTTSTVELFLQNS